MVINIFSIIAIIGLLSIISGTFIISMKRKTSRKYTYPLLIIGGICLEIYSIYLQDIIFIILQGVFILSSIYGLIKLKLNHAISLGGRSYWKARKIKTNNDFSMAEAIRNRPTMSRRKFLKETTGVF